MNFTLTLTLDDDDLRHLEEEAAIVYADAVRRNAFQDGDTTSVSITINSRPVDADVASIRLARVSVDLGDDHIAELRRCYEECRPLADDGDLIECRIDVQGHGGRLSDAIGGSTEILP